MGTAASAAGSPPVASPPPPSTDAARPADPPMEEEPQRAAASGVADKPATSADGGEGSALGARERAETVVVDVAAAAGEGGGEGEEELGECGICLFMKGGGCKEEFVRWLMCVEKLETAGNVNIMDQCQEARAALRKCMDAHADYYEPVLRVERAIVGELEAAQPDQSASGSETTPSVADASEEEGEKKDAAEAAGLAEKASGDPAAPLGEKAAAS